MSTSSIEWDRRFMDMAGLVATWSKDPHEGVGAVVVSQDRRQFSPGYNGLPRGHADDLSTLYDKELKNLLTIHAERNALDNAPFDVRGGTIYVTKPPCVECAKGIIQRGIGRVVCPAPQPESRWYVLQRQAYSLLESLNVAVDLIR